jgi:hypothetical protein
MSGEPRCPVCGRAAGPAAQAATCGNCGWLLYQPLRAGPVTAAMRRDFDARLRAARQAQAERDERALGVALGDVLSDLRPGTTSSVIDIGDDEVTVTTARLDDAGSPQVRETGGVAWASLLPMLAAAGPARQAQLAGGIDGLSDDRIGRLLRDRIPAASDEALLVICRPAGWRVLEAAATALAARPRARLLRLSGGSSRPAAAELGVLAAQAPLRHPYRLMTAAVDRRTGAVTLRSCPLFAAGAGPGTEATLTLRRMPGDGADMTLAIFTDTGRPRMAEGAAAAPLALYSVPAPPGLTAQLRAVLDGPGRVRIVEPPGAAPHRGTWAQVRDRIPRRVRTAAAPVDLVCAIDLAGSRDTVRRRVSLVRDLVELLGAELPGPRQLRVGVVTCTDHVFVSRRGAEYDRVISASGLGPATDALTWLGQATGAEISYPLCAPVEDLLDEALRLLGGSTRLRRVPRLLTVAGRLPHPYPQRGDERLPCPHRLVWEHLMDQLTRRAGVRCAVVADALPGGSMQAPWAQLGPAGQRELPSVSARQVAEDLGLLAAQDQCIPLPLTDESEREPEGATR